jgi:hypothetical protein
MKNKRTKCIPLFLCLLLAAGSPTAANDGKTHDAGLWIFAGFNHKPFNQKWVALYGLEYRSKENFKETSLWSLSANMNYILTPFMQVGAGYEFFLNHKATGGYYPEHRYYPELLFLAAGGGFSASLRLRLMNTFTQLSDPNWEGRNRLKVSYAIRKTRFKPFVSIEPYNGVYPAAEHFFKKIRYTAGSSFALDRHQKIDLYYLCEDYLYDNPFVRHVIQLEYNLYF